ncbi:hypothetical protein EIP86_002249, partial [Pleurotus ostreatoroseus]
YRVKDLEKYVQNTRQLTKFKDLSVWKRYNRGFIRIAGWLQNHGKLDEATTNLYFWKGIPRNFRKKLETSLSAHYPDHDLEQPWTRETVQRTAEKLLQRNRFDHERLPSDDESDDDFSDLDIPDSDYNESDDTSDDDEKEKKKKKKDKQRKKKKHSKKEKKEEESEEEEETTSKVITRKNTKRAKSVDSSKDAKSAKRSTNEHEVEDLINRLNKMSINDSEYAGLYLRAVKLNPMKAYHAKSKGHVGQIGKIDKINQWLEPFKRRPRDKAKELT